MRHGADAREALAEVLGVPAERIRVIHTAYPSMPYTVHAGTGMVAKPGYLGIWVGFTTERDPHPRVGPRVRIRFPPAASLVRT